MGKKLKEKAVNKASIESHDVISDRHSIYTSKGQLKKGIDALRLYVDNSKALKYSCSQKKDLLSAGKADPNEDAKVIVEIVFKMIPENRRTFIHDIALPHHWRLKSEPEDCNIALFVRHVRPADEIERIQFKRDRDLDIENTHQHYVELLDSKLDGQTRSMISMLISTKELVTEYKTYQLMDKLPKAYDLFLADKPLMANKLNPLPRQLGRRFWVRERKVPLSVNLKADNLQEEFNHVLKKEQFYVTGRGPTETMQIGLMKQSTKQLASNMEAMLMKVHEEYGNLVRFIRLRTNWGVAIPVFADLGFRATIEKPLRPSKKMEPVIDEFDMLSEEDGEGNRRENRIEVYPDGKVNIIYRGGAKRSQTDAQLTHNTKKSVKKTRKT